jgi:nicotinate-nucleotide adenylyltransferase
MVEAAVAGVEGLEAGRWEIDHGGPSFTATTLAGLARIHPDADFFTIVGDDAAAGLTTWERLDDVLSLSEIVVVDRPGVHAPVPDGIPCHHVEVPHLDVSSTDLRRRIVDGRPLDFLVTSPVLTVINERALYSETVGSNR